MVKLLFCARRLPHLSRAEFQKYWHENHGPLVKKHAAALGIRRYVQVHTLDHPIQEAFRQSRGGPEAYDGVAELWWDSLDSIMGAATRDPKWQEASLALLEDEKRFIDLANSPLRVGTERPVLEGPVA
jgi:uncharacterized protein (TIGR02118 family)